ncbi:hexose kinase [Enterococcus sp. LJL90]
MIITVTMNPSLDMAYPVPHLIIDDVNRVTNVSKTAGGKGLNVTRVLKQLGATVVATGLIGGNIGRFITEQLTATDIAHDFYEIAGESRHSIAILHDEGKQTELLETGPEISELELAGFLEKFVGLTKDVAALTISGSLPPGVPQDFYQKLINLVKVPVLLDSSGKTLAASLAGQRKPFLIKPNLSEIQELVGVELSLDNLEQLKDVLQEDIFTGIEWLVISMGSQGALAKHNGLFYRVEIPKIAVVNPVGSGDATLAGLAYSVEKGLSDEELLKTGMVCGMLNAQEHQTGWINPANFSELFEKITVTKI